MQNLNSTRYCKDIKDKQGKDSAIEESEKIDKQLKYVTESKLMLLAAPQDNMSREELLGQEIATLFRKPAAQEDW